MFGRALLPLIVALLLSVGPAAAQPMVFWFNDPVGPDETILVTGADLDAVTAVTIARIPDAGAPAAAHAEASAPVLQANPQSLKAVVPADFTPGIFRVTLHYAEGSATIAVNLPTVYWAQGSLGEAVAPGGWVQIFGRNIVRRPERARLLLVPDGTGATVTATLSDGGMWRARFRIPDQAAPGAYHLRLSNGDGGDGEWVDAGHLEIHTSTEASPPSFDVRAYGAIGDGKTDSTPAFKKAIEAANRGGGGTVYIPRGRYLMSEGLVVPPGITLQGERTDLVNLVWPDFASPPDSLIKGTSRFTIEDVTIYASNHLHIVSGGFVMGDFPAPNASDISVRRVRIRASAFRGLMDPEQTYRRMADLHRIFPQSAPVSIRLSGDRLEVIDCDVVGSGSSLFLFKASNAVVSGNSLGNGRNGNYAIMGSRQVIFENNLVTAVDLQATGGAINTVSNWVSASENVYAGGNVIKGIYGWDREAMTTDGPGGYYFGHAESAAADRLSLLDDWKGTPVSPNWAGALIMVVNGRGAGQYARVRELQKPADGSRNSISLDRPLSVPLDASSLITVAQAQLNYLIIDNSFEDTGVAAQSFGTAVGHVIAGNRATRSSGFFAIGLAYGHFQPSWQVQLLDNRIIEGNVYRAGPPREALSEEAAVGVHAYQTEPKPGGPPLARAIIIRGNQLEQDAHIELKGFSAASPGIRDVIVEANTIGPSRVGLRVDGGVASLLQRRNAIKPRIGR
jgi:hypothetical protein